MDVSYDEFVGELCTGTVGKIIGYDVDPGDRCVIYLAGTKSAIFIERVVIEQAKSEAISLLQTIIREGLDAEKSAFFVMHNGSLVTEYETSS